VAHERARLPGGLVKSAFSRRDAALFGLLALLWGHSFLFIKTAVATVPPAWIVTARMTLGGLLLLLVAAFRRDPLPRDPKTLMKLTIVGLTGSAFPWMGQAWAQRSLDSGLLAVLNACTPLMTLAMAVISKQEQLQRNRVMGILIAICGTLIVLGGEVGSGRSVLALLVAVLATVGYAFAGVYTRAHISGRVPGVPAAAVQLLIGALVLVPIASALSGPPPAQVEPLVALSLLALGLLGTGVSFLIFFTLIGRVGATNTAMVTYLIPLVAMSAGAVYRGERFGANVFVGALALIGGVWYAQRNPSVSVSDTSPNSAT
jgi:drug/metabolite transporter (DMT)-like permease